MSTDELYVIRTDWHHDDGRTFSSPMTIEKALWELDNDPSEHPEVQQRTAKNRTLSIVPVDDIHYQRRHNSRR